jgi:hypothetical protein
MLQQRKCRGEITSLGVPDGRALPNSRGLPYLLPEIMAGNKRYLCKIDGWLIAANRLTMRMYTICIRDNYGEVDEWLNGAVSTLIQFTIM